MDPMHFPYYRTPEGQSQIVYVWHIKTGRPMFTLPQGDYNDMNPEGVPFIRIELSENFEDYQARLPVIAWMLTRKEGQRVRFIDGHGGECLAEATSAGV